MTLATGLGCSSAEEDSASGAGAVSRTDPSAEVSTAAGGLRLLTGYNALLDKATPMTCAVAADATPPDVDDLRGQFYLRQITSREDLAKELEVDVGARLKMPQVSANAATKVVNTFKSSSTTVTFLVRAVRSYLVTNRAPIKLEPAARDMLVGGRYPEFLQKCGGSFARSVRYQAQVIAILQFEAQTEETAQSIRTSVGASSPSFLQPLTSAEAEVKTKAEQAASKYNASLSLTVTASGFLSSGRVAGDVVEHSFEKIDQLRADMSRSFEKDLADDRAGYLGNHGRNVSAAAIGQTSYAGIPNAPSNANYTRITSTLGRAEEFLQGLAGPRLRMESVHADEVGRFLSDEHNQFRYNLLGSPKLRTRDLVPIAQKWSAKFAPDGARASGSLVAPLRSAAERCLSAAGNGNYEACATDQELEREKNEAETALGEYARSGRIVKMNAWMPRLDAKVSYRNADGECRNSGMRVPKRDEMRLIAPTVTALAGSAGEVWFAADSQCQKPFFVNGSGQGAFGCGDTTPEPLPYVEDRPVVCVGLSGPAPVLAAP